MCQLVRQANRNETVCELAREKIMKTSAPTKKRELNEKGRRQTRTVSFHNWKQPLINVFLKGKKNPVGESFARSHSKTLRTGAL
jgi:hypothetical protein